MEKKTIEEAAEDYADYNWQMKKAIQDAVKFGAEWYAKNQSEQMYSVVEVVRLLEKFKTDSKFHPDFNIVNWFNLNKKS
jgi:predicted amidophosphoribosyltransferase